MEKVSVILPIYNVEKYLKNSIRSVQNQTYENLEIILVDDGSTDNSGKICDEIANVSYTHLFAIFIVTWQKTINAKKCNNNRKLNNNAQTKINETTTHKRRNHEAYKNVVPF